MKRSWIETFSESLGLISKISDRPDWSEENKIEGPKELYKYPDPSEWHDFKELDAKAWPENTVGFWLDGDTQRSSDGTLFEPVTCLLYTSPSPRDS